MRPDKFKAIEDAADKLGLRAKELPMHHIELVDRWTQFMRRVKSSDALAWLRGYAACKENEAFKRERDAREKYTRDTLRQKGKGVE